MVDVDDDRPLGVQRCADVAPCLRREARARPAAADQPALDEAGEAQRAGWRPGGAR
jgi:hypothetical protein